jgi:hypothetical protein
MVIIRLSILLLVYHHFLSLYVSCTPQMCGKPESFAVDIDQTANIGRCIPHTRHTEVDNTCYFQYLSIDHNIEDAITLFRELGQQQFLAMALNNLGCTKVELDEYTAAYTEPKLKAARLRLGEAGFKVFWEEGHAMTVEQAITLAEQALQLAIHTEVNSE